MARRTNPIPVFRLHGDMNLCITWLWAVWSIPGMDKVIYSNELFWS